MLWGCSDDDGVRVIQWRRGDGDLVIIMQWSLSGTLSSGWILSTGRASGFLLFLFSMAAWASAIAHLSIGWGKLFWTRSCGAESRKGEYKNQAQMICTYGINICSVLDWRSGLITSVTNVCASKLQVLLITLQDTPVLCSDWTVVQTQQHIQILLQNLCRPATSLPTRVHNKLNYYHLHVQVLVPVNQLLFPDTDAPRVHRIRLCCVLVTV